MRLAAAPASGQKEMPLEREGWREGWSGRLVATPLKSIGEAVVGGVRFRRQGKGEPKLWRGWAGKRSTVSREGGLAQLIDLQFGMMRHAPPLRAEEPHRPHLTARAGIVVSMEAHLVLGCAKCL